MRIARIKYRGGGAFYHVMNRTAGTHQDRPFGPVEQEMFVKLLHKVQRFYTVEVVSYTVMSNHWHAVIHVPCALPSEEEAVRRYNSYYEGKRQIDAEVPDIEEIRARMIDFSCMVRDLQQSFTIWFNRTRMITRRGRLWADRFKSVLLDGKASLWTCIKYIELNSVRAGIVENPADYRFCSWGVWNGSGKHPFGRAFFKYVKCSLGERARHWSVAEVADELRADIARTMEAARKDATGDTVKAAYDEAKRKPAIQLVASRRVRYWTDGAVIGSKLFVQQVATEMYGEDRAKQRRYGTGELPEGGKLFSLRCLREQT